MMKTRLTAILAVSLLLISIAPAYAAGTNVTVSATPEVISSSTNTVIHYTLTSASSSQILVRINDSDSNTVRLLDEGVKPGGTYSAEWNGQYENGTAVPDGIFEISVISRNLEGSMLTSYVTNWGSRGPGPGQFSYPWGIAVSPSGRVYVADRDNNRVQVLDPAGRFAGQWGGIGAASGKFYGPWGIAVNSTGYVYVTDRNNCRVQVFDANGTFVGKWGSPGTGTGQFYYPEGIAVNSTGYVYVADTFNNRIQLFDPTGKYLAGWAVSNPRGLAVNATDYLYVVSGSSHRIQIYNPDNIYVGMWGSQGAGSGQFSYPWGIATDAAGLVYVTDVQNYRVQVFNADGSYLAQFGAGLLAYPTGIGIAAAGQVYVADTTTGRILVFGVTKTADETCGITRVTVDNTPPVINLSSPSGFYLLNQPASAEWGIADSLSGIETASGTTASGAPIDTSAAGSHSYRVIATDRAGNTNELIVTYTVGYQFYGLLSPLGKEDHASFRQGSAVPVKFRLEDANGEPVSGALSSLTLSKVVNGVQGAEQPASTKGKAGTVDSFRYDQASQQYVYNLDTKPFSPGTWQLIVRLDDGTVHTETIQLT